MKNKHIIRTLKKEAKKIPTEEYEVFNKFYKPLWQDAKGDLYAEKEVKEGQLEGNRRMVRGVIEKSQVNHGRRIKKAFKMGGMPAVDAYFFVKAGMSRLQPDEEVL